MRVRKKTARQVDAGPFERERKLLLVFFLRIALFANLLGLGRFLAALVRAFLAFFFGFFAAGLSRDVQCAGKQAQCSDQG